MRFVIDAKDPTPPYEQLVDQITSAAGGGKLSAGFKMPTVRALAVDLGLAPNTVAKVYRKLESAGVIETRGRAGTFISERARRVVDEQARKTLLDSAANDFARAARQAGVTSEQAISAFRNAFSTD